MVPIFRVLGPRTGSTGSGMLANALQRVKKFLDGGFAQFRIGGMRHAAVRDDFIAQRAFGAEGQLVFRRLAVDDEVAAARVFAAATSAPALLRSSPTTNSRPKLRLPSASRASAAMIMEAMMPLVSQAPRPQICSPSSREGMKGGTVSMWVERTTMGSPKRTKTLSRSGSTGIRSAMPSKRRASRSELLEEIIADFALIRSYRFDIDKGPRQLENVHDRICQACTSRFGRRPGEGGLKGVETDRIAEGFSRL